MFIKTTCVALLLLTFAAVSFSDAEARGRGRMGGMRMAGGHAAGMGMRAGGRSALGGGIRLGRGGRGVRRGYSNANQGPTVEQQQASYFQERRSENPYSQVPQQVNVNNYVKQYQF